MKLKKLNKMTKSWCIFWLVCLPLAYWTGETHKYFACILLLLVIIVAEIAVLLQAWKKLTSKNMHARR